MNSKPNFGPPVPGTILWRPTEAEVREIKARGVITSAAKWDSASVEQREAMGLPGMNPRKRWFEQIATVHFPRSADKCSVSRAG